jgi:SAM-dependent methyltransferase
VETLGQALGAISGGRVLDVATGEGDFIRTLVENLRSYVDITGIDIIGYTEAAGSPFRAENVHFVQMDAAQIGFEDESFDTVSISSSLHHLENIPRCVTEMNRVLRPEGHFILRETHRDVRAGPQRTDMVLHHWVAEMDSALGEPHNRTFTRQELVDLVEGFGLVHVGFYDISNTDSNPVDETAIQESEAIIDRYMQHARGLSTHEALTRQGEAHRRRLHKVGIQWEPELIIIGQKPLPESEEDP